MALAVAVLTLVLATPPAELEAVPKTSPAQPGASQVASAGGALPRPASTVSRIVGVPPLTLRPPGSAAVIHDRLGRPSRGPRPRVQPVARAIVKRLPLPVDRVSNARYGVVEGSRVARAYARARLSLSAYRCLNLLWTHESGWRWNAVNRAGSGAYGIPQALPGSKMAKAGADWKTNPVTQVRWGLGYISGRYGNACAAWSFWRAQGWY